MNNVKKRSKTFYVEYFVGSSMDQKVVKQLLRHANIYAKHKNKIGDEKTYKMFFRSYQSLVKTSNTLARKAKRTNDSDYRTLAKRAKEMAVAFKEQIEDARRKIRNNRKDNTEFKKRIDSHYKKLSIMASWLDSFKKRWHRLPTKKLYNEYHKRFKQLQGLVRITQQDMNYLKKEHQIGGANRKKIIRVHYQRVRNVNEVFKDLVKQYVYDQPPQNHPYDYKERKAASAKNYDYYYIEAEILDVYQLVKKNINAIATSNVLSTRYAPLKSYYRKALEDFHEINDALVKSAGHSNKVVRLLEQNPIRKLAPGSGRDDDNPDFPKFPKLRPVLPAIKGLSVLVKSRLTKLRRIRKGTSKSVKNFERLASYVKIAEKYAIKADKDYKRFKKYILDGRR